MGQFRKTSLPPHGGVNPLTCGCPNALTITQTFISFLLKHHKFCQWREYGCFPGTTYYILKCLGDVLLLAILK